MIQAGSGLRLAAEAAEQMLIGGDVVGKKFESNETAETGVLGLINHSHSAATELFDHPVMRDGLAVHDFWFWENQHGNRLRIREKRSIPPSGIFNRPHHNWPAFETRQQRQ